MARLLSLTSEQQAAVNVDEGSYLLVAPPGSGKTEVLVRRIMRLLGDSAGQTFRVLAVTFTTKAAENVRSRALSEVGEEEWRLTATTFHAFCLDILQHYGDRIGVPSEVTVYETTEDRAEALVRGLVQEGYLSPDDPVEFRYLQAVLFEIDKMRNGLLSADDVTSEVSTDIGVSLHEAYQVYERALESYGAIDFTAMLTRAHELLVADSWVAQHYRKLYKHILVDEAQDMNLVQYEVLKALCGSEPCNVLMVADRNQSIYGFTGAGPIYVDRFMKDFGAQQLPLSKNFRSAEVIVAAANELARHFSGTEVKSSVMGSGAEARGSLEGWVFANEEAEARGVCQWIGSLLNNGLQAAWIHEEEDPRITPEDICVLARTRYALDGVAASLDKVRIPCLVRTPEGGLFDSDVGRAAYYGLKVIANDRDLPSRRRLLQSLASIEGESWVPPVGYEDLAALDFLVEILASTTQSSSIVSVLLEGKKRESEAKDFIADLVALDGSWGDEQGAAWDTDKDQLETCWRAFTVRIPAPEQSLGGFLRAIFRLQRATVDEPGVRILTVHAAKGLEFRAVALIGMNDGTFPDFRSLNSDSAVNEERRSAYVAVTRAARALRVTRPRERATRYGARSQDESRFIGEMKLGMEAR